MDKGTVRIKDIAEKANVSTGTVDRVLHNRGRVSEEARRRVMQTLEELSYEPNLIARTLGANRQYRVAALVPDHLVDHYWLAPKTGIEKAEKELRQYGLSVRQHVFNPFNVKSFLEKAEEVTQTQPDGVLVAPIFNRESMPYFSHWQSLGIPYVLFNTQITGQAPLSYIGQDSCQSGFLAAKLLHYGQPEAVTFLLIHIDEDLVNSAHLIKKEQGFFAYFARQPAPAPTVLRAELHNPADTRFTLQLDELLEENPGIKGIFVTTSRAHAVAAYLHARQLRHIRLVGYDLIEKNLDYLNKGTIDFLINQNPKGQGYWGVSCLADHLVFKKEISALKYLPLDIITKENLHYYVEADN